MRAEIIKQEGDILTVRLFDKLTPEEKERYEIGGRLFATLELYDPDGITHAQRKHIYALFGDMEAATGYPADWWERYIKLNFMHLDFMTELPSFAAGKMSKVQAGKFIEYLIIFMIQNEIPFRDNRFYLTTESSKILFYLVMNKLCVVCGEPHADLHHATNLVGMGNDRTNHKHWNSRFLTLCRTHHTEAHYIGLENFNQKYHLKPVKLTQRNLKDMK